MLPSSPRTPSSQRALLRVAVMMLLAALGLVGMQAGTAAADNNVPWTVSTTANSFGTDRQNFSYTLNPGGQLQDGLVVVNHGTTPLDLAVYAADGFTTDQGQLDLRTRDANATGVGAWVHADRDHVKLRPGESAEVPFTITVPASATPGDHLGGIVTSLTQADKATGMDVDRRLAVRIRLRVGGELKPSLSVEDLKVHYSGTPNPFGKGDATVSYTIHNTGNTILAARPATSISGPFGRWQVRSGQVDDSPQLLPGDTWKVSVPVHRVTPAVRLAGTVAVVPLLTDAAGSTSPLTTVETTTHTWTIPWALLLILVALCGLVVGGLAFRRRRGRQDRLRENALGQDALAPSRARETSDQ
jgi:hypothetical protein